MAFPTFIIDPFVIRDIFRFNPSYKEGEPIEIMARRYRAKWGFLMATCMDRLGAFCRVPTDGVPLLRLIKPGLVNTMPQLLSNIVGQLDIWPELTICLEDSDTLQTSQGVPVISHRALDLPPETTCITPEEFVLSQGVSELGLVEEFFHRRQTRTHEAFLTWCTKSWVDQKALKEHLDNFGRYCEDILELDVIRRTKVVPPCLSTCDVGSQVLTCVLTTGHTGVHKAENGFPWEDDPQVYIPPVWLHRGALIEGPQGRLRVVRVHHEKDLQHSRVDVFDESTQLTVPFWMEELLRNYKPVGQSSVTLGMP